MLNKKTIFLLIALITVLLLATTISATDNTTTEKIQKTTTQDKNIETNIKQDPTNNKEVKKTNAENKTAKKASNAVNKKPEVETKTTNNVSEVVKLDVPSKASSDTTIKVIARVTKDGVKVNGGKLKIVANWNTIYENPILEQGIGAVFYKTPSNSGNYTIIAQYLKNGKVISQDKKIISVTAPKIKTSMPTESETDKQIKIVARVSNDGQKVYSGKVKITANGKTIYNKPIKDSLGAVFYKTPGKAGTYTIISQYINNGKVISQEKVNLKVINTESISYIISGSYVPNSKLTLNAYVKKPSGTVNNGNVRFKVNGKVVGTKAVKNGKASMTYKLPGYKVDATSTAEYIKNGVTIDKDSQRIQTEYGINTKINAPTSTKQGNTITIKANVNSIFSESINSGRVSFSINNQWIGSAKVKNNIATISYKATNNPGDYTLKATYIDKNNNVASNTNTQKLTIQKADTVLKTTLDLDNYQKRVGDDILEFGYYEGDEELYEGIYVFLYKENDMIPSTYRLLEAKVYYEDDYGDIITRTVKVTDVSEYGVLYTPEIDGYYQYKVDVSYRKMTSAEKKENTEFGNYYYY